MLLQLFGKLTPPTCSAAVVSSASAHVEKLVGNTKEQVIDGKEQVIDGKEQVIDGKEQVIDGKAAGLVSVAITAAQSICNHCFLPP